MYNRKQNVKHYVLCDFHICHKNTLVKHMCPALPSARYSNTEPPQVPCIHTHTLAHTIHTHLHGGGDYQLHMCDMYHHHLTQHLHQ